MDHELASRPLRQRSGKTVYHYFQQALRNSSNVLTDLQSVLVSDENGNCAAFEVNQCEGKVTRVRFKCTTCMTLVALCEHIAELAQGNSIAEAWEIDCKMLLQLHPEVPARLRNRADLASKAFHGAIEKSYRESQ